MAIGVFDSGIGGLTVLKSLVENFPLETFIYLGDTARLPYGSKSTETIRKYSEQNISFLLDHDVKAVVIACNSASSQFLESSWQGINIYNVIHPGAKLAAMNTRKKRIGVLGTRATIQSRIYEKEILKLDPEIQVLPQACPLFVPLAEEALFEDPITNLVAYRYIQPLLAEGIDALVLGCTHYPLLEKAIRKVVGNHFPLIDSGVAVTQVLKQEFQNRNLDSSMNPLSQIKLFFTDASPHLMELVEKILFPIPFTSIEKVDL
jgi:glutamate racemase